MDAIKDNIEFKEELGNPVQPISKEIPEKKVRPQTPSTPADYEKKEKLR